MVCNSVSLVSLPLAGGCLSVCTPGIKRNFDQLSVVKLVWTSDMLIGNFPVNARIAD